MEGNLRFKIDWARLIVGSKFTVSVFFYFVFEGNFPSTSHWGGGGGGLYLEGRLNGGFFCVTGLWGLFLEGLIFGILQYFLIVIRCRNDRFPYPFIYVNP